MELSFFKLTILYSELVAELKKSKKQVPWQLMLTIGELEDEIKLQKARHVHTKEIDPMKYMVDDSFIEQVPLFTPE
jgi:hypothetical protein